MFFRFQQCSPQKPQPPSGWGCSRARAFTIFLYCQSFLCCRLGGGHPKNSLAKLSLSWLLSCGLLGALLSLGPAASQAQSIEPNSPRHAPHHPHSQNPTQKSKPNQSSNPNQPLKFKTYLKNVHVISSHPLTAQKSNSDGVAWQVPRVHSYVFQACMANESGQQIKEVQIIKLQPNSSVERLTASKQDAGGCFLWTEHIKYNFLSTPHYKYTPRLVQYTTNSGTNLVPTKLYCFVNPWAWWDKKVAPHEGLCLLDVEHIKNFNHLKLPDPINTTPASTTSADPTQAPTMSTHQVSTTPQLSSAPASSKEAQNSAEEAQNLWVDDLKLNITHRLYASRWDGQQLQRDQSVVSTLTSLGMDPSKPPGHLPLHINISFRPYTRLSPDVQFPLKGGSYRVWAYVVASDFGKNRNEKLILNPFMEPKIARFVERDGRVHTSIQSLLTELVEDGNYHLLLRIQPVQSPTHLKAFEAVYNFAIEWNQLLGQKTPSLEEEAWRTEFQFDHYLATTDNGHVLRNLKRWDAKYSYPTYEYGTMEIRFQRIKPGETATIRTVQLRAKVCVTYTHNGSPVRHRDFKLQKLRDHRAGTKTPEGKFILLEQDDPHPAPEIVTSDADGCLVWFDEIRHRYYMPEKYIFPRIRIQDPDLQEEPKELTLVVNPWDEKWTFGHDSRDLPEDYVQEVEGEAKANSRFYLTYYSYQTLRFRYHIDHYMNLMVRKTVLLSLVPRVLRYSSIIWGRRATELLRDGVYLMKIAYQKDFLDPSAKGLIVRRKNPGHVAHTVDEAQQSTQDNQVVLETAIGSELQPKQYITAIRKLVRVQDGRIITPIELGVRDLRLMKIRSNLLIQLETIDEADLLEGVILKKKLHDKLASYIQSSNYINNLPENERQDFLKNSQTDRFSLFDKLHKLVDISAQIDSNIKSIIDIYSTQHLADKSTGVQAALDQSQSMTSDGFVDLLYRDLDVTDTFRKDLRAEVDQELTEASRVNDFTMYDMSPFRVSLNHLIDHDSGLQARTFLGPITLIFNSTGANMRPTDNLSANNCEIDDCNDLQFGLFDDNKANAMQRQRGRYENSKFFGSSRDFKNKSVDSFIVQHEKNESQYITYQRASSLLWDFVNFYKLKFVSLADEPLVQFRPDNEKCRNLRHDGYFNFDFSKMPTQMSYPYMDKALYFWAQQGCLQVSNRNTTPSQLFFDRLNSLQAPLETRPQRLEKATLWEKVSFENMMRRWKRSQVKKHEVFTSSRMQNFIDKFFKRSSMSQEERAAITPTQQYLDDLQDENIFLYRLCAMMARIYVDKSILVKAHNKPLQDRCYDKVTASLAHEAFVIEKRYRIRRVTGNYNFKGGKSLNINIGDDFGLSHTQRANLSGKFNFLGRLMSISTFGTTSIDKARVHSRSFSEGTKVSSQTFLVVQTAALDIELGEYEKCLIFRWKPQFLRPTTGWRSVLPWRHDPQKYWSAASTLTEDEKHRALLGGLMLCKGKVENEPIAVRERYYYMTQHFTDGDMLDPGDLYNHPWLLRLRGVRDFETFIQAVRAQHIEFIDKKDQFFTTPLHSSWQWPIKKLNETYRNVMPTFPGMYAQILRTTEEPDYPWTVAPNVRYYGTESKDDAASANSWGLELSKNIPGHWTQKQIEGSTPK